MSSDYPTQMDLAREVRKERLRELATIEVVLQVENVRHARSKEVIEFSSEFLRAGGTWGALRRKLGLGHAAIDKRWREVRNLLVGTVLPNNEEEALKARNDRSNFLVHKLEQFVEDLDDQMENVSEKNLHHYFKTKLDAIKMLSENADSEYEQFLAMQKLRQSEKKNQGVSIVFQNNYHVPRPGDNVKEVSEVKVAAIMSKGNEVIDVK